MDLFFQVSHQNIRVFAKLAAFGFKSPAKIKLPPVIKLFKRTFVCAPLYSLDFFDLASRSIN